MVERSLSMREVPGSIPGFSIQLFFFFFSSTHHSFFNLANNKYILLVIHLFCTIRLMFRNATNWISGSADSRVTEKM